MLFMLFVFGICFSQGLRFTVDVKTLKVTGALGTGSINAGPAQNESARLSAYTPKASTKVCHVVVLL